ncbi:hypothetical protein PF005_g11013 [Phytophthora fragariae]|uniref:Uncharacterized protein n=1 Tax=Phytophthora fragariae TaxID=53985 RepID=A0A6A3Y3M6_9STRA|nr:hypothetical protein PF009_g12684 [Phytophthora fragariae]KAE9100018.1 hypothetical protein PF007_g15671 [Phytophthora fragariae]KAE9193940.1 hypothetical protein PF004_g20870 [Phytophthora fragariae]KAE9211400.1 hypothetical protein PF005_g11013 [Phytophthora fragariae]KAE9286994.1 hypothetical protein PF001_g21185 [Phytophthora fragariae]
MSGVPVAGVPAACSPVYGPPLGASFLVVWFVVDGPTRAAVKGAFCVVTRCWFVRGARPSSSSSAPARRRVFVMGFI